MWGSIQLPVNDPLMVRSGLTDMVKVLDFSAPAGAKQKPDDDGIAELSLEIDVLAVLVPEAESAEERVWMCVQVWRDGFFGGRGFHGRLCLVRFCV
jgi:hypothetical protein